MRIASKLITQPIQPRTGNMNETDRSPSFFISATNLHNLLIANKCNKSVSYLQYRLC